MGLPVYGDYGLHGVCTDYVRWTPDPPPTEYRLRIIHIKSEPEGPIKYGELIAD